MYYNIFYLCSFQKENKYYNPSHPFSLTRDNPIFEVPRQFYLAIVLSHLYSPDYPGVNECITYIANKGQKSRYKAYLEKRFEVPEPSVEVKVTEPNRKYLFVTFGFAIFWTLLVLFVA